MASRNLSRNLRQLRESRQLSQEALARAAGIPRATWAHLESGQGNPTLLVLMRAASALQVSVDELIGPPRAACRRYGAAELPARTRSGVTMRRLLPDVLGGIELDRMALPPETRMGGVPHRPGTREYLACEAGSVTLTVAGETWRLEPGDVVVFRGDQRHSYANTGSRAAVAYSVVLLSPQTGDPV